VLLVLTVVVVVVVVVVVIAAVDDGVGTQEERDGLDARNRRVSFRSQRRRRRRSNKKTSNLAAKFKSPRHSMEGQGGDRGGERISGKLRSRKRAPRFSHARNSYRTLPYRWRAGEEGRERLPIAAAVRDAFASSDFYLYDVAIDPPLPSDPWGEMAIFRVSAFALFPN